MSAVTTPTPDDVVGPPLLVLIGPPGAGKTRTGKRVARRLGARFIDTDRQIVAAHGPIEAIFAEHGEAHFRAIERDVVRDALGRRAVVSLGGGAVLDEGTQRLLHGLPVALLTVTADAVAPRLTGGKRPLIAGTDPVATWSRLAEQRAGLYSRLASRSWDTSHRALDRIADDIADWVASGAPTAAEPPETTGTRTTTENRGTTL